MNTEQQDDLEAIRQLKARYFRLMDTKQWESWSESFTSDVSALYEGAPRANVDQAQEIEIEGRDALLEGVKGLLTDALSIHQGYMPEIQLTSATTATGIWSMFDDVRLPTCNFKGWGHYHDEYVKEDGQWKLKRTHLTRLHIEEEWV